MNCKTYTNEFLVRKTGIKRGEERRKTKWFAMVGVQAKRIEYKFMFQYSANN
jgi:hypothetical protein